MCSIEVVPFAFMDSWIQFRLMTKAVFIQNKVNVICQFDRFVNIRPPKSSFQLDLFSKSTEIVLIYVFFLGVKFSLKILFRVKELTFRNSASTFLPINQKLNYKNPNAIIQCKFTKTFLTGDP